MKAELDAPAHGELWLRDAVGHDVGATLTKPEALAVTAKIKGFAGVAWILLWEAHNRKAHKAMGYKTWGEYVAAEFDMSRSYSYRLISQASVVLEISAAAGVSPMGDKITEREARDLQGVLPEAKAAVIEATEALPADATPEDKTDAVQEALDRLRTTAVEAKRPKAPPKVEPGEAATREGAVHGAARDESSPDSLTPKLRLAALFARQTEVREWIAFDGHEAVILSMSSSQRADYGRFLIAVSNHVGTSQGYLDKSHLKAVKS